HGARDVAGGGGAAVRAFLHHQARRPGTRTLDQPLHRRGARRSAVGDDRLAARHDLPRRAAAATGGSRRRRLIRGRTARRGGERGGDRCERPGSCRRGGPRRSSRGGLPWRRPRPRCSRRRSPRSPGRATWSAPSCVLPPCASLSSLSSPSYARTVPSRRLGRRVPQRRGEWTRASSGLDGRRRRCHSGVTSHAGGSADVAVLSVLRGNRLEDLADRLVELVRESPPPPLTPETVVVQSQGMARWLSLRLAHGLGVAANIRFPLPGGFLWDTFRAVLPHVPDADPLERRVTVWHLRAILDALEHRSPEDAERFAPVHEYLRNADEAGGYELAARIADLFDQYLVYRPQWIARWEGGADEGWRAALWRSVVRRTAEPHRAQVQEAALRALGPASSEGSLPRRVAVFGIPILPPSYLHGFRRLAEHIDVHLFLLAPCRE